MEDRVVWHQWTMTGGRWLHSFKDESFQSPVSFLHHSEGVWAALRSEGSCRGTGLWGCVAARTVSGSVVSAAFRATKGVAATGLKPLEGQPVRRGWPWRRSQRVWGSRCCPVLA